MLKDTTAMTAEREALRMGVEQLMTLFLVETKDLQFVIERESGETKYIVDTQSMRLFGLRNDHAEDVHRADGEVSWEKKGMVLIRGNSILSKPKKLSENSRQKAFLRRFLTTSRMMRNFTQAQPKHNNWTEEWSTF